MSSAIQIGGTPSATVVLVTPATAEAWLSNNHSNRALSPARVEKYAAAMRRDEWDLNGETIKLAMGDQLLDGQHRLAAIVRTGKSVPLIVVSGLDPAAFTTIDIGKKRSRSDTLAALGYARPKRRASTVTWINAYHTDTIHRSGIQPYPSNKDMVQLANAFPVDESILAGEALYRSGVVKSIAVASAAHFLFSVHDNDEANKFMEDLRTGANLDATDPALLLRNALLSNRPKTQAQGAVNQATCFAWIVKAWNALQSGKPMRRVIWGSREAFPEVAGAPRAGSLGA